MKDTSQQVESSLTDWKKEPSLTELSTLYTAALPHHSTQVKKIKKWRDLLNVEGVYKPKTVAGKSSIQPKLIRKQAEWRYSSLSEPFLGTERMFEVKPSTFEDVDGAKQNELLLNWQFRTKLNRVKLIDEYVRATADDGTCIVRTGWERITKPVTEQVPVYDYFPIEQEDEEYTEQLQQAVELRSTNPRGYNEDVPEEIKAAIAYIEETGIPVYAVAVGTTEETVDKVISNKPTIEVLNPENVIIDPTCNGNFDKALFIIVTFETSKFELLNQGDRYQNLDKIKWNSSNVNEGEHHASKTPNDFNFTDTAKNKQTAFEYWGFHDINDDGYMVPVVATWIGNILIRMEESPFSDGKLPFVVVPYSPRTGELYGIADAELLEDNQAILGAVLRGAVDLMGKSANSQTGIQKGLLDTANQRRYERGEDYFYNPTSHPANAFHTHKYPELPNSVMQVISMQNQEAEALTGVKSFSGGISGASYGNVATGIRGALDAASKREMAIIRRLAKGIIDIGNKIIAMNSEFLSDVEVIRVTNKEFVSINREDLIGNFDLIVDISTAEIDDAKAQDLAFMVQTVGPNAGIEATMMLMGEIADLKRMPDLAERLRTYQPQPTPEEQELQEMTMMEMKLKLAKLESEILVNQAKAHQLGASGDKTNVETLQKEDGTEHERNMASQKAQSKGNQNLEITKSLLKSRKFDETSPNIDAAFGFKTVLDQEDEEKELDMLYEQDKETLPNMEI